MQLMDMQTQFTEDHRHLLYFDNGKTFGWFPNTEVSPKSSPEGKDFKRTLTSK